MKVLTTLFSLAIFFSHIANAQDPEFVQFYSSPLYLNPAFAGSVGGSRAGLTYRNEWITFNTYHLSYDQYVHPVRGGVGLNAYYDKDGEAVTNTYTGLIYSPVFIIKEKISIKPAIEIGYLRRTIDWDKINWGGVCYPYCSSKTGVEKSAFFDLSTGLLINTNKFYGGFAIAHLFEPKDSFNTVTNSKIPRKYTVHIGYNYQKDGSEFSFSPNAIYKKQQDFDQIDLGLYARYAPVVFGIWYRQARKNSDAFIFMLSIEYKKFRIGYSYDITLSKLSNATAGSHEFTLGYLFNFKNKEDKIIPLKMVAF